MNAPKYTEHRLVIEPPKYGGPLGKVLLIGTREQDNQDKVLLEAPYLDSASPDSILTALRSIKLSRSAVTLNDVNQSLATGRPMFFDSKGRNKWK